MAEFVNYVCLVFTLLLTILGNEISAGSTERTEQHPARDFTRHTLTKPRIYHGREKRQISTTKEEDYHIDHLTVNLPVDGEEFVLDLTLNKQLIPKGFFRKVQENGKHEVTKPSRTEIDLCHYNGKVRGRPGSWVALSTCHGLSGVIYDGEEMHYVERDPEAEGVEAQHLVFRHSDLAEHNKTCGFPDSRVDPLKAQSHNRMHRYKRAAKQDNLVRGPYNANKESKYVELVLVVDNQEYKELGESTSKVEYHCKTIANIINGLYAPLNIFIALVGVVIWTDHDEISFSPNGDTTLTNFLHYRREKLVKEHPNDNAQLLTKFTFENGVVGKALKGPICTYEYSGGVNTDHSSVVGLVATTVAHEMGHNFGMEHDTNECTCPDDRCIMAPSSSTTAPTHWSSCSINYLLLAFTHGMDYCLKNKPESLFGSPVCGNGFVEPGEQCDCGLPEHCDNTCCNATTCMLYGNASCATGECCDLTTCKPKNAGTLCRSADYECDLPEYCTGQSEYCPSDIYKRDTEVCDDGNSFCYHGFCRTRTDQCKLLWGETGKSSDEQCYKMNVKGNRHGNCGYNKLNQSFFKCTDENVLCGMLHCKHLNERLEFGMESVSILSHSFLNLKGSIVACRTAMVDLGINQVDPGLSPDGAKCGEGKMCVNQRCMSVESLKTTNILCPHNCNNNGWCNNLGHCHCKDGFAPPYCEDPGPGGSEDSGPASDPNAGSGFVTAMFIIFLAVIPSILVCLFAYYYMKHNGLRMPRMKKPPPPPSKSPSKSRSALPAKRNEANHSLLQEDPSIGNGLANEFFGQFKGFTLTPKKTEAEPIRAAPPPPIAPPIKTNFINRSVSRAQSFKQNITGAISSINNASTAPALPPPNPGSTAKPIISSPILENSTCTAKELISPLKNAPSRPAPQAPALKERPVSTHEVQVAPLATSEDSSIKKKDSTLNRIASFLTKKQSNANSAPSAQVKASKIDKDALKSIEISGPILQKEIEIKAVPVENKPVMRAQSMRTSATTRPNIPNFGSMRQTGAKRPMSIPAASRPKSPPPPVPLGEKIKLPSLPGYQKPTTKANQYDDCLNKKINDDNIYAVIEESPTSLSPQSDKSEEKSKTSDNMGLLSEIVSEIQNRNFDSIYSTSTLARKKKEAEEKAKMDDTYVNASVYKSPPESVYSNMNNASASSTSSGYIHPSSVNAPVKTEPKQEPHKPMSTFKSDKPYVSPFTRPAGPFASTFKSNQEKTKSPPSPVKTINRQVTPPNLRTRKSSPVRAAPVKPKQVPNSPDLVTSCNSKPASKGPDVLNVKKPVISSAKPILNGLPKAVKPPVKSVSFKTPEKKAPASKTAGIKNVTRSNSNVASLQQKFENKANVPKPVVKSKT